MKYKIVYQTDSQGVYIGETIADQSPLDTRFFLIPDGCVEEAPPLCDEGHPVWSNGAWTCQLINGSQEHETEEPLIPLTEEQIFASEVKLEREWRDGELKQADLVLNRIQDGMSGFGTVAAWRQYRVDLRNWPETEGFPNSILRPKAPQ